MVNDIGGIIKSFGEKRGSSIQQLDVPACLAVDESGNILVLDRNNSHVLLLSPALEFKMVLLTKADGLRRPVNICIWTRKTANCTNVHCRQQLGNIEKQR